MIEYVDQDSDWFKKGFIEEFQVVFRTFTNFNFYHFYFKDAKNKTMYVAYPDNVGMIVTQNTLYVAYSRTLTDLNEYQEAYSLRKVGDKYKIDGIMRFPGDDVEFIEKAMGALLKNNAEEAISYFKKAIEANPENSVPYCRLGMIYSRTGRLNEGLAELKKAVELRPNVGFYRLELSQLYKKLGEKDKALEELARALALDPGIEKTLVEQ